MPKNLTWVWPTRAGCRRVGRQDLVARAAELLEHLQAAMKAGRLPEVSLASAAQAAGWSTDLTAVPLLLLHHTAAAAISPKSQEEFRLYVYNTDEFTSFDAKTLSGGRMEPAHVQSAAELLMRYAEGDRDFAVVLAHEQDFRGAVLDDVEIHHGSLRSCDFRGASFRGATLGEYPPTRIRVAGRVDVFGLDLGAADFADASFERADLRGADLTDARLDGARFDADTQISEAALSRAKWEVVFRGERLVRRGQWAEHAGDDRPVEPEFSLVPDVAFDTWTVKRGGESIKTVNDAGGVRLIALLMANPSRSIHALDAHAALERRPLVLEELGQLDYEGSDVADSLRALGLRAPHDAKPDVEHRLRACLRELDRVDRLQRSQLLEQMKAELHRRRLNLSGMPYVRNIVNNLRKQGARALAALAGDPVQPLVAAIELGELSTYKRG